jgi:hypothetical protein
MKISVSAEKEYKNECQDFIFDNGRQIYIVGKFDGVTDTLFFDTGNSGYGITHTIINDTLEKKNVYKRKTGIPGGKIVFNTQLDTFHLETDILNCKRGRKETIIYPKDLFPCMGASKLKKPIIESGLILSESKISLLSFSRQQICLQDSLPEDIDTYINVKSEFKGNSIIYIYITIDGIERKFIFDTGSSGSLIVKEKDPVGNLQEESIMLDGAFGTTMGGYLHTNDTTFIKPKYVFLSSTDSLFVNDVNYTTTFTRNNAGIRFISRFDWVIDMKTK